jgi:hypothetical protein
MRRNLLLIPGVILALALASCGGVSDIPATGQDPVLSPTPEVAPGLTPVEGDFVDACVLLPPSAAERAVGGPVDPPSQPILGQELFAVSSCLYQTVDEGGIFAFLVSIQPTNGDEELALRLFQADQQNALEQMGVMGVDVDGLGDQAYWLGDGIDILYILKDDIQLQMTISDQGGPAPPQRVIDMAEEILTRLEVY